MGIRALILSSLLLAGCASTGTRNELYFEYIEISNPQAVCGQAMCVERTTYKGEPLCKVIVGHEVDKGKVGALLRQCVQQAT